jgi:integrase
MARQLNRIAAVDVRNITRPGRHSDGGGLYLVVDRGGAKRWAFLFRWRGKLREMGLGGTTSVSLKRARELAADAREKLADGINPIEARRASDEIPTFGKMADDVIAALRPGWRNAKHAAGWTYTLGTLAAPLRPKPVDQVTTEDVLSVLSPIWQSRNETASRLRGRIERVLDAAKAKGFRSGENPARWRGHLSHLLSKRRKLSRGHHAAMPFADVPAFMANLRAREATAALGLEFLILTASRTGEVLGATAPEFDLKRRVWTVPAERMKGAREHRVPLSPRAAEIAEQLIPLAGGGYIFPGAKRGKPLSTNAFRALLQRMDLEITAHGFRSSFRDWASEVSTFPAALAEAALAHVVGDDTERAYRRGDVLEKRRRLMDAWAAYCEPKAANVVAIGRRG